MSTSYFYLRPGAFGVVGFAYGKTEGTGARGGKVKVKLVSSGRWSDEQGQSAELTDDEIASRTVTAEEALNGAGTFVGGVICTSRVKPGGARVWDYGLVTGYKWCAQEQRGLLDMNFGGVEVTIVYSPDSTQDVAVEIYALQPCGGLSTSLVMASEMKKQHEAIYNKFNGIECPATRDSTLVLADAARKSADEARLLPLLDITSFEVSQVAVRHILDYVFFKEGGRTHPTGMEFGDTIFDEVESQRILPTTTATSQSEDSSAREIVLSDGLSDSDEDEHVVGAPRHVSRDEGPPEPKRRRRTTTENGRTNPVSLHQTPVAPAASGLRLDPEVDQLIALHRSGTLTDASAQGVFNRAEGAAGKAHFQPTGMQTTVHLALVNGKYASLSAQQFVDFVQVHWRKFGFFPHPAVLRGLFGWDFGTRGLSILHFVRVTELEKRELVRKSDMSNFSKKNALPPPSVVDNLTTIAGALDVLTNVARQLYQPAVHEALEEASTFLAELRVSELPTTPAALAEISAWIDDRLELFRVFIADESWAQASVIKSHFSASHESFVRVHQLILRQDVASALKLAKPSTGRSDRGQRSAGQDKRVFIPVEIRKALPKQGNKQLCLRFLSNQGCRGKNGNCIISNLCHFKPATLPDSVREFVTSNYGGLATDMQ